MVTWPSTLPQSPLIDDYQMAQPFLPGDKTPMDSGVVRYRPKYSQIVREENISFVMTEPQLAEFEYFVWFTIYQGTLKFQMPIRALGSTVLREVQLKDQAYTYGGVIGVKNGQFLYKISFTRVIYAFPTGAYVPEPPPDTGTEDESELLAVLG